MTAAHRMLHPLRGLKRDEIFIHSKLVGAGANALVESEPYKMGSICKTLARTSEGIYTFVFQEKFAQTVQVLEPCLVSAVGTVGRKARWTALDLAAGTGTLRVEAEGGSGIPAWTTVAVSSDTSGEIATAGPIVAVELAAGTVTGAGNLRDSAAANSRDVEVNYSAAGLPTLNFLAADAVTSAKYVQIPLATVDDAESTDTIYIGFVVRNVGTKAD